MALDPISYILAKKALSNVSDSSILTKLKNVDGSGSGLDADLLDGHDSSYFATASHTHNGADITNNVYSDKKRKIFVSSTEPVAENIGDIWIQI